MRQHKIEDSEKIDPLELVEDVYTAEL